VSCLDGAERKMGCAEASRRLSLDALCYFIRFFMFDNFHINAILRDIRHVLRTGVIIFIKQFCFNTYNKLLIYL